MTVWHSKIRSTVLHTTNITEIMGRQLRKNPGSTVWIKNIRRCNEQNDGSMMSNHLNLVENNKTLVQLHKNFNKLQQKQ